jgi:hypothetical protein
MKANSSVPTMFGELYKPYKMKFFVQKNCNSLHQRITHHILTRSFNVRDVLVPSVVFVAIGIGARASLTRVIRSIMMLPALAVVTLFILVFVMKLIFMLIAVLTIAMIILVMLILVCVNVMTINPNFGNFYDDL